MKKILFISLLFIHGVTIVAQDSTVTGKKWQLNGYVKDMEQFNFGKYFQQPVAGNLVHNRINVKWIADSQFTAALGIRNRLFWGDQVSGTPGFAQLLQNPHERVNASVLWVSKSNLVLHSNIERLWVSWHTAKWDLRLGRQRIDWGITTIWNPNDLFNPYNFLDFDYEEKPGADAAKISYLFDDRSNLEVAASPRGQYNKTTVAARYFISKWGYDLQILGGLYNDKVTFGFGWAGNLGNFSYKGEGQAFVQEKDSGNCFDYSLQLDYSFKKGWRVSTAVLHNTKGLSEPVNDWSKLSFQFTPQSLMPARWSFSAAAAKEFTPLFRGNLSLVHSLQVNMFIIYPSLQYNLLCNLDIDLVWQSYFLELQKHFEAASHRVFLRLKWGF